MLVVVPFFQDDSWKAKKNIEHAIWLDGAVPYPCLLSYDNTTGKELIKSVRDEAEKYFSAVLEYSYRPPTTRKWPMASNHAFHAVVWHLISLVASRKIPKDHWLWWESDSTPLKKGWLKQIDEAHIQGKKPFTGHWNSATAVWNGVSVYPNPPDVNRYVHSMMLCETSPWDVVASKLDNIEKHLNKRNDLFQHNWADPATNAPFTFRRKEEIDALIRPTVVLFHRCKDGSLIDVIQGKAAPQPEDRIVVAKPKESEDSGVTCEVVKVQGQTPVEFESLPKKQVAAERFVVAVPFCAKDAAHAEDNLRLCLKLDGSCGYNAIISYDTDTPISSARAIRKLAEEYFVAVDTFVYRPPTALEWPKPQNHAWSKLAAYIQQHFKGSWFWWESDAVPLKKGWLDALVNEFNQSQKFFMGYIVEEMGHMNGVAFYPCNIGHFVPNYGSLKKAFDVAIRQDTIHLTHRANHLFQNMWGFNEQGIHSFGTVKAPSFPTQNEVDRMVDFSKVIFHRCKDGTLTKRLLERK